MADYIRPTPRNPILGLLADALTGGVDWMRDPRRAQQMQGLGGLLAETGIPATMERLSYGEPLTTGRGMTTRLRPEAEAALLTLSPAPQATSRAAMAAGRAGERMAERMVPQIMERGGMPAGLLESMSSRTVSPLTVYHGSPHKFEKFDASKIGTGEGAQSYGYGLYVAESPEVAKNYMDSVQGLPISPKAQQAYAVLNSRLPKYNINKALANLPKEAIEEAKAYGGGALYTIDLPDSAIARMLDWDKPLSEQPEAVAELATVFGLSPQTTGGQTYDALTKKFGTGVRETLDKAGQSSAASVLRQRGIPGIRYLDQGSRGVGQGTSNFVVFPGEEGLLRILKRNEDPLGLFAP